jgi:antitoxin ParD1/3/4
MPSKVTTINISLPKRLRAEIDRKVAREAYGSASEYLRDLIRRDLRSQAVEKVDALLLEGVQSGPPRALNGRFWRKLRAEATKSSRRRA